MIKFAIAGNPNSGKTTLFNILTGSNAHVANWPGVTVDKKEGVYKKLPEKVTVLDLPGIYSLSPYSPEEVVARKYILEEKPDVIINIVDATNLERNLYLTTQLLESEVPVVVALNMTDLLKSRGETIDADKLSKMLNVPVVAISAVKSTNIQKLMETAYSVVGSKQTPFSVIKGSRLDAAYNSVVEYLNSVGADNILFRAAKILENDSIEVKAFPKALEIIKENYASLEDIEADVADVRYTYITENYTNAITRSRSANDLTQSDKIDKVLTHKIWGIPIFAAIMFAIFHIIFSENFLYLTIFGGEAIPSLGVFLQAKLGELTSLGIEAVAGILESYPAWIGGLVVDGLLSGIDAVLSFLPQMLLLFLFLSILEDSGYMARVAFIMDRAFKKFGLSGKAFMPLLMCFGCAVPGILATKALENENERRISITIAPFISCGAKLPIWAVFAGTVFAGRGGEFIVFSMYALGIIIAIAVALIMKKRLLKNEVPPFVMELPTYHRPRFKSTLFHLWDKFKHYVGRVATVIAGAVIVIWFLQSFNFRFQMVEDSGESIIGILGKSISWIFAPLGFGQGEDGWKFVVAALTGLIAKEMVVATLGVFSGMEGDEIIEAETGALVGTSIAALLATISIPAALSFMAFNLLSVPCMAAVGAASGELGNKKLLWKSIAIWISTAYIVSFLIYWIGTYWWISLILTAVLAIAFLVKKYFIKAK